jgi:hypothetical protein
MNILRTSTRAALAVLFAGALGWAAEDDRQYFLYDVSEGMVIASVLDDPNAYDADILSTPAGVWIAWLKFEPGQGDSLWYGRLGADNRISGEKLAFGPARIANPTLTADAGGRLWLTFEAEIDGNWQVLVLRGLETGNLTSYAEVSAVDGPDINHRVAAAPRRQALDRVAVRPRRPVRHPRPAGVERRRSRRPRRQREPDARRLAS